MIVAYEAIDREGRSTLDTIEASGVAEAGETLRNRGLYVTHITEKKNASLQIASSSPSKSDPHLPLNTLAMFTRQMSMLLNSGSAVVPAVNALRRQMKPPHAALLGRIVADLEEGSTLTDALRKFPRTFDPVYCAIVAAGEASGHLAEMFQRLYKIVGKRRAMRNTILGALAYPTLLIIMSVKILVVLLIFVLPRFNVMFEQLDVEAPASTQMLLHAGVILRSYWHVILAAIIGVVAAGVLFVRSGTGRQWLVNVQLKIPLLGRVRARLIQGQIFRTMGTLLESSVGLLETLDLARRTTTNDRFVDLFRRLDEAVTSGGQLSSAVESSTLIEPYICQAMRTGEESGSLGEALSYCADILDETNTELVSALTRLIEPIILILLGVVVGGVAISLFLPLFDLTSAMN